MASPLDSRNLQNGLSNAGFSPALNEPRPSSAMYKPPERISVVDDKLNSLSQLATFRFPSDLPKYFVELKIAQYARWGALELGKLTELGNIVLPLPLQLTDNHNVTYIQEKLGMGLGTVINAGSPIADTIRQSMDGKMDMDQVTKSVKEAAGTLAGGTAAELARRAAEGLSQYTGANILGAAKALSGYSPNQFLTILFEGPQYKIFQLDWLLTPKNEMEAVQINRIVRVINNAMAPSLAAGGALFRWPNVFYVNLHPNSKMLMKFKPAVLQHMSVNYSGGGQMSFFRPSPKTGNLGAPESVSISMNFLELEFWLSGDFKGSEDPRDVVGDRSGVNPFGVS